jgi:hypothetical protein
MLGIQRKSANFPSQYPPNVPEAKVNATQTAS